MKKTQFTLFFSLLFAMLMFSGLAGAEDAQHKVIIQVSTDDPVTQKIALNNAVNLQQAYGIDNITIEIVAYGPGLSLMTEQSKEIKRVESLSQQEITFSACGNTIKGIEKKTGKKPVLAKGVRVVPAGVGRLMEAQEEGYAYIRP